MSSTCSTSNRIVSLANSNSSRQKQLTAAERYIRRAYGKGRHELGFEEFWGGGTNAGYVAVERQLCCRSRCRICHDGACVYSLLAFQIHPLISALPLLSDVYRVYRWGA
jgi:hypothetical protein